MKKSLVKWIIGVAVGVALSGMTVCAEEGSRPAPSTNIVEHYDNRIMYVSESINDVDRVVFQVDNRGYGWFIGHPYNVGVRVIGLTDSGYYVTEGWGVGGHCYQYIPAQYMQDTPNPGYVPVSEAEILTKLAELQAMYPEGTTFVREYGRRFARIADEYVFGEDWCPVYNPTCRQSGLDTDVYNINIGDTIGTPDGRGRGIVTAVDKDYVTVGYEDKETHVIHWNVKYSIEDFKREGCALGKRY